MHSFHIPFKIQKSLFQIKHGDKLLFLGSCFSDEISEKAKFNGFDVTVDPFGTIFHPEVIARNISESIQVKTSVTRIIQRNDLFFSWDASGQVFGYSKEEVQEKIAVSQSILGSSLKESKVLFVTFGTAWGYMLKEQGITVANCHKQNSSCFDKQLAKIDELEKTWRELIINLKEFNNELKIVFTVSPVRHIKDGLVENNQSKSVLIELVRRLQKDTQITYFPSYEIVLDELRDYRFFKKDRVHPNEEAIDYVWNRFKDAYFDLETIKLTEKVEKIKLAEKHRSLYSESEDYLQFKLMQKQNRDKFQKDYPNVKL